MLEASTLFLGLCSVAGRRVNIGRSVPGSIWTSCANTDNAKKTTVMVKIHFLLGGSPESEVGRTMLAEFSVPVNAEKVCRWGLGVLHTKKTLLSFAQRATFGALQC